MIYNAEALMALSAAPYQYLLGSPSQPIQQTIATTTACGNPPLSCGAASSQASNTCCINSPGGLLLQTQFWDTRPASGPSDSWTVHGLWPDNCDGSYEASCDHSRSYSNITDILTQAGADDLVSFMRKYWKDEHGRDEVFWEHEWNKHGTCISTIEPKCYSDYEPQREVVDFFNATVSLFQTRDSYALLEDAGITPDHNKQYPLENVLDALAAGHDGIAPALHCTGHGELNEIWWFFNTRGNLQTGEFVPAKPKGARYNCPHLVTYVPKHEQAEPGPNPTSTGRYPGPTHKPGQPFSGRGTLGIEVEGQADGCVIGKGTWFRSGTCAKFTATPVDNGFDLKSTKGYCGIRDGMFGCGGPYKRTVFHREGNALQHAGSSDFYSDEHPRGTHQAKLYTGQKGQRLSIVWQPY